MFKIYPYGGVTQAYGGSTKSRDQKTRAFASLQWKTTLKSTAAASKKPNGMPPLQCKSCMLNYFLGGVRMP